MRISDWSSDVCSSDLLNPLKLLPLQACNADHEELVEIASRNREEAQPLKQRVARVARFFQHAKIERQPRKLAIEIAIAQRRRRRIGIGVIDDKFHNSAYYASDYESSMTPRLKSTFLASGTVILRWAESAAVSSAATTSAMPEKLRSIRARI